LTSKYLSMPKPDQNVSSSAALQRPQRQKALPKPVAKNIETDLESTTQSAATEVTEKLDISEETSPNLTESLIEASEPTQTASFSEPTIVEFKPEPKKVISIGVGAVDEKTKPKLKPKLKPVIDPIVSEPDVSVQTTSTSDVLIENIENTDRDGDRPVKQLSSDEISADFGQDAVVEIENSDIKDRDAENIEAYDEVLESNLSESLSESQDSNLESDRGQVTESVTPIFWCQAVGLVAAKYVPSPEAFHKGELITDSGFIYKAYVLSKAVKSLEKKIDLSLRHHFVVYPKTSKLHGVRFEILATDISSKIEEFNDGEFNIRGLITKHAEDSVLIEIQRRPEYVHPAQYDRFSLEVKGNIPAEMMQQFIYLKCQLTEDRLSLVSYEHLACPITPKLTKTEKPILKPKVQKIEPVQDSTSLD
jgi:hypothetical protein